jgi:hypothetical protein
VRLALVAAAMIFAASVPASAQQRPSHKPTPPIAVPLQPPSPSSGKRESNPPQNNSTHEEKNAQPDRRGTVDAPLIVEMRYPPKTEQQAAENAEETNRKASADRWTIGLTGVLAFATIMQFLALGYQGIWLRRTVKIAETALTGLERPHLFFSEISASVTPITEVKVDDPAGFEPNVKVILTYRISNYGRAPGIVKDLIFVLINIPPLPRKPNFVISAIFSNRKIIGADLAIADIGGYIAGTITFDDVPQTADGRLFVFGKVRYSDTFGNRFILGFGFRKEDPERATFHAHGGKNYNYQRADNSPENSPIASA